MSPQDKELLKRITEHLDEKYQKGAASFDQESPRGGDIIDILRNALALSADTIGLLGGIYAIIQYLKGRKDEFDKRFKKLSDAITALPPSERELGEKVLEATREEMSVSIDE